MQNWGLGGGGGKARQGIKHRIWGEEKDATFALEKRKGRKESEIAQKASHLKTGPRLRGESSESGEHLLWGGEGITSKLIKI